jgi:hypothetical protein
MSSSASAAVPASASASASAGAAAAAAPAAGSIPATVTPTHPARVELLRVIGVLFSGMDMDRDGRLSERDFVEATRRLCPANNGDADIRRQYAMIVASCRASASVGAGDSAGAGGGAAGGADAKNVGLTRDEYVRVLSAKFAAAPDLSIAMIVRQLKESERDMIRLGMLPPPSAPHPFASASASASANANANANGVAAAAAPNKSNGGGGADDSGVAPMRD